MKLFSPGPAKLPAPRRAGRSGTMAGGLDFLRKNSGLRDLGAAGDGTGSHYLALLRIDQLDAIARSHGGAAAEALMDTARTRIVDHVAAARIGRSARGMVEFAFPATDPDAARTLAERLLERLDAALAAQADGPALHLALGLAGVELGCRIEEIVERAQRALTLTETTAARCVVWTERDHADAANRLALARDLRAALAAGQLSVAYQPKLHLKRGVVDSAEALVRWTHPERGPIPPDVFVPLAEESGDIARLTHFVLSRALADRNELVARGHDLCINVNLSGRLVADEMFCAEVLEACAGAEERIGLEITETAVFTHPERALRNLRRLADGGVSIAIDDYGSGLSSLAYLKQLPAAELKIDRLFISSLTSSHRDPLIVRSTIDLAHALEMEVTAEGVDHPASLALLRVMGCDRAQGYHIAAPLPLGGMIGFMDDAANRDLINDGKRLFNIKTQSKTSFG